MTTKANAKVLPHGPIETLEPGLFRVEGALDHMPLRRVMVVVRLDDGTLLVHGAMALDEAAMRALDALGRVAFIVVPNGYHRLDAPRYHERYPDAKIVAPAGSLARVRQVVPVDLEYASFPASGRVSFRGLAGVGDVEGVMVVRGEGTTLVFNDALFDMPHLPGAQGWILRHVTRSSGPLHVSRVFSWMAVRDRAAFAADLAKLADTPDLRRVVVAHHRVVDVDPAGALRRVATELAPPKSA